MLAWADHRIFAGPDETFILGVEDLSLFAVSPEAHRTLCKWRSSEFVDPDSVPVSDFEVLQGLRDAQILLPVSRDKRSSDRASVPQFKAGKVPLSTLVLEVAQDCNLQCTYCYADGGTYGAAPCLLDPEDARAAVRYLLDHSGNHDHVTLVFFGGEPLLNMPAIKAAVNEAASYVKKPGKQVHFSVTTNGTMLDPEIVAFLHAHRIAVAVSLDGPRDIHDRNRPDENGRGSYTEIVSRLEILLKDSPVPVAARVTLVPDQWHRVPEVFDHLIELGFHEVGIAPVSPVSKSLLPTAEQEAVLLAGFGELAQRFVAGVRKGFVVPFSNILDLLGRLHLGQARFVSCGAGLGYMAVDAKGRFFPCHRLTGAMNFCAGSLSNGIDADRINISLAGLNEGRDRHCSGCWARTLCAGGCHYENDLRENQLGLPRGSSCRLIRSWLELGLRAYVGLRTDAAIETLGSRLSQRAQC